tara:strand:- start:28746 stop:29012 length:267 start_codon:yes stop_codon:yes gene_type:complete
MKITDKTNQNKQSNVFRRGDIVRASLHGLPDTFIIICKNEEMNLISVSLSTGNNWNSQSESGDTYKFKTELDKQYSFTKVNAELIITD